MTAGPFFTEAEVRALPSVQAVYAAFDADPGRGKMAPHNAALLAGACQAAGVELADYDRRILEWMTGYEPETCAVIASWVERAAAAERQRIAGLLRAAESPRDIWAIERALTGTESTDA